MISENKEKLQAADVTSLEGLIKEGRAAVEKQDDAVIKETLEKLEKEAHRLAGSMYANQGGAPGADGTNGANGATDGVVYGATVDGLSTDHGSLHIGGSTRPRDGREATCVSDCSVRSTPSSAVRRCRYPDSGAKQFSRYSPCTAKE
jgi:hypothetical protein